jgi:uncharacterized protein (TIGR01777 family)
MCAMRVTVTGATGLIGASLVAALRERDAQVTVLTRDADRARARLGDIEAVGWDPLAEPAPVQALEARDAVLHLAGEPVAQRWSAKVKRAIRDSRALGTRNLVEGLALAQTRPPLLLSSSATGIYGAHGEEPLDEDAPPGSDFLARVCVEWEAAAAAARELPHTGTPSGAQTGGTRVVQLRTGVVLDRAGGALAKMLPPFKLGVGGPVAGGHQYMSWIHAQDVVGMMLAALTDERWSGPVNATAPDPVPNRAFSRVLGRVLGRPSLLPVPGLALRALYGEMAEIVTTGARVMPAKALVLGYEFAQPQLEPALRSALTQ